MLVKNFEKHCHSDLYTVQNHSLDYMVKDRNICRAPFTLDSSPFEYFNVHIEQVLSRTLQR